MANFIQRTTKKLEHLAAKNSMAYRMFSLYYKRVVRKEAKLANINVNDRVLCVGGGPCPFSGILLHEYTKAHVTIIDNDMSCVEVSRQLIHKLGYEESITVLHSDGNAISPEDYTVVHMAVQVSPLEQVFNNLNQKCRNGSKILVRLPKTHLASCYGVNSMNVFNACQGKANHILRNISSTALFVVY